VHRHLRRRADALAIAARTLSRTLSFQVASNPAPPLPRSLTTQLLTGQYSAICTASGFSARNVAVKSWQVAQPPNRSMTLEPVPKI